ncbi:CotH kinase family protein [Ilumatobacter nonamiensis]|uniref:CotH kinase family protein n=1 Tax=Ilumatobacter nonamiensis TaxID=467093 RepID=UPI00058BF48B|nr:CotH kinase family protein [Ilumatobacter nonamiensis]
MTPIRTIPRLAAMSALVAILAACSTPASEAAGDEPVATDPDATDTDSLAVSSELFDSSTVHTISVGLDETEYDAMIQTFTETGEKDWISIDVTIDGETYENAGMRLKGNSSLFGLSAETADNPEDLPWLIDLDEFVDGQDHDGVDEIVIRSNSTETGMNEAVAQELLSLTGLASQDAIATAFTVNGGETELRLAVENPDGTWHDDNFDDQDGLLYKADSEGDYSYRGDDPDAYDDVFDQEAGDDDLTPLIGFLDFINNSDDATFAAELGDRLDVDAFATYLAYQDLIGNDDDIDGRGNNSYLQYDTTTDQFTVVSWDLNLAFGTANVGGGGGGAAGGGVPGGGAPGGGVPGELPVGGPPAGAAGERPVGGPPAGDLPGAGAGGSNILVERFMADDGFAALYAQKTDELTELLFTSGTVDDVIADWSDVLIDGASDLVGEDVVMAEAAALTAYADGAR